MKKFLIQISAFLVICCLCGEFIVRAFKLVSDIPHRSIDPETGLQLYKPGQTGYFKHAEDKWVVNEYGWLGVANTGKKVQFSVIGDSYVENLMNPISCNQGYMLNAYYNDYGFFEAGRSGVSFIEALEISKKLDKDIAPDYHLIYLNKNDFSESLSSKGRYRDIVQIDLEKETILKAKIKSPLAKKVLYSSKLLYYFYGRYPLTLSDKDQNKTSAKEVVEAEFDEISYEKLFDYIIRHYDKDKFVLIFHPNVKKEIIGLSKTHGIRHLSLSSIGDDNWGVSSKDSHWSCYGHTRVAVQVKDYIDNELDMKEL